MNVISFNISVAIFINKPKEKLYYDNLLLLISSNVFFNFYNIMIFFLSNLNHCLKWVRSTYYPFTNLFI